MSYRLLALDGRMRLLSFTLALIFTTVGCRNDSNGGSSDASTTVDVGPDAELGWQAVHVGPPTGFVSAVEFGPGGVLWLSGDDASGLYRSTDGGTSLVPLVTAPLDWSTQ